MAYTTKEQVRRITNITTSDVSDTDVDNLITDATAQVNSDINTREVREMIRQIDNTRTNEIDGSNTTFYVRNFEGKYIGDMNDSGTITIADIIVYQVTSAGVESKPTISSVDSDDGSFVMSSAPSSGVRLFVTYEWCYDDPATPSKRISLATAFLTAAYCYNKINTGMSPQQVYGNVRFMRDMRAHNKYFQQYEDMITKINGELGDFAEAEVF